MLYNPKSKKVIISRDVKFAEEEKWEWENSSHKSEVPLIDEGELVYKEGHVDQNTEQVTESEAESGEPIENQ